MANAESYPISAIFAGDILCPIGSTTVTVQGIQTISVTTEPPADGAVLTFVQSNNDLEWLPDVDIFNEENTFFVSLTAGDVLVYNGTDWTNSPLPEVAASTSFDVNGTPTSSQTLLNFQSGSNITVSNPSAGNVLVAFSGTLAHTFTPVFDEFLTGYNATTGLFTAAQPALAGLSDVFLTSLVAGDVLVWNGSYWIDSPLPLAPTLSTISVTTISLAATAKTNITLVMAKQIALQTITVSAPARIEFYQTAAAMIADAARPNTTPPILGTPHQVIGDWYLNGTPAAPLSFPCSPMVFGQNGDNPQSSNIYVSITNIGAGPTAITATITYVEQET
jgi:hypothetical protein